jgi:predicted ATPase
MIERLYVQNFRCLESFTLDLKGHSSALLIGKNAAGKSTVRHSLQRLQKMCRGSGRVGELISTKDFSWHDTTRPLRIEVDVTLDGKTYRYSIGLDWPKEYREARIIEEKLTVDGREVFRREDSQVILDGGGGSFGLNRHIFALPVVNERPPFTTIQTLKTFFASMILVAPVPDKMAGFSDETSALLAEDASNFASCLRDLLGRRPRAYGTFEDYVRDVFPDFSSIENVPRGQTGFQLSVRWSGERAKYFEPDFEALSDGEKCLFLASYIVAANTVDAPVFCFWDEPDNHLSLSEVANLVVSLRKMSNNGGQFMATSHHPETVRTFSDETTIVLTRKSHLDPTIPRRLSDVPREGDLVNALIRGEIIGVP